MKRKLALVIIALILLAGCAIQKPVRNQYENGVKYEKELKSYYEKTKMR